MTNNEIDSFELDLKSLKDIKGSRGWNVITEAIRIDLLNACLQMADNPTMTETEIHFRRGAISAARNFVNVLDLLIARTEGELLLAAAEGQTQFNLNATAYKDSL